MTAKQVDTG